MKRAAAILLTASLTACLTACPGKPPPPPPAGPYFCDLPGAVSGISVPDDLCVHKFASIRAPRVLAFAPNGDLFVASPSVATPGGAPPGPGGIAVLPDDDGDGTADNIVTFAQNHDLSSVHGILFAQGQLYYTLATAVMSVPYSTGDRSMHGTPVMVADLSDPGAPGTDRWTHTLGVDTTGQLYVTRGQFDNDACPTPNKHSGSVLRIGPGHDPHGDIAVSGFRNPMYMRCEPWGACYAAELSGDDWTALGGKEKLIEVHTGDDYGYPCCVDTGVPLPTISPAPDCSAVAVTFKPYPLHATPFGFEWEPGKWPAPYTNAFFVAFHGDFSGWTGTALSWAPVDPATHRPTDNLSVLVNGFGRQGAIRGRVTDLTFAPDGRLFFSDDQDGGVYWVAPKSLKRPGM
jgi:glucose/arabinose dehydrogenase